MDTYLGESSIVECQTTVGTIVFELYKEWSPEGYKRAVELFERGFYDKSHFFRVIHGFLVQFGISYTEDEALKAAAKVVIPDDPPIGIEFDEGIVSFAGSGRDSRTSHLFIAYGKIPSLGTQPWETPIGKVIKGIENVRKLNGEYGDGAPNGNGPPQYKIHSGGRKYMEENFPHLDSFHTCSVVTHITREDVKDDQVEANDDVKVDDQVEVDDQIDDAIASGKESSKMKENNIKQLPNIGRRLGEGADGFNAMTPILIAMLLFLAFSFAARRRRKKNTKVG